METVVCKIDDSNVLVSREIGCSLRIAIESKLKEHNEVVLDFNGVESATHSCIDEMIGTLVVDNGAQIFSRLVFSNCSPAVKSIISFVARDRLATLNQHPA